MAGQMHRPDPCGVLKAQHVRRVRVPHVEVCAEISWALTRAFGSTFPAEPYEGLDHDRAFAVARVLNVVPRIGSRCSSELLEHEVGRHAAAFRRTFEAVAVRTMQLGRVARRVAALGSRLGTQVFVLKGMAATATGITRPGSRPIMDVDVLVPTDFCSRVQEALEHDGFRDAGRDGGSHHFPMLVDRHGNVVEVHEFIRLKPDKDSDFVTADFLLERGLYSPAGRRWPGLLVPDLQIQVAHALRHALVQHLRARNWHHFPAVVLGDLLNLGWTDRDWERFREEGHRYVDEVLSWDEVLAAVELAEAFRSGEGAQEVAARDAGEGILLRRWLASAMSEEFRLIMAPPRPRIEAGRWLVGLNAQSLRSRDEIAAGGSTPPTSGRTLSQAGALLRAGWGGLVFFLRVGKKLLRYMLARSKMALLSCRGGALRWPE